MRNMAKIVWHPLRKYVNIVHFINTQQIKCVCVDYSNTSERPHTNLPVNINDPDGFFERQ